MKVHSLISFAASLVILAVSLPAAGQVAVERSKDKVIISGVPYYIHVVKKGETAYSLSRAYNITIDELTRENPPALYGIKEGQALRIPFREEKAEDNSKSQSVQIRDESKYVYHKLQPGETIYYLSRLYGVSENEIVASNPKVDISRLPVNSEIAVPRRRFMSEKQQFAVQDSDYIFHKVLKGETLASIAGKYDLSIRDLRRENRNVRFPQVGDFLRIPVPQKPDTVIVTIPVNDTLAKITDTIPVLLPHPDGFTPVHDLRGSLDVAVLLPFYLPQNAKRTDIDSSRIVKGRKINRVVYREPDWIYPASLGFVEMYEGILLAADTLRSLGADINLHIYDIRSDTVELSRLMNGGKFSDMDLIIGPVYSHNLALMTRFAGPIGIPVISPVHLFTNSVLKDNPNLFLPNASLEVPQEILAKETGELFDNNIVFIHSDTSGVDPDVINFRTRLLAELSNRLPFEEIRFREFTFYSKYAFNNDSINRLSHALSKEKNNLIIIASEDEQVISETLMEIHGLAKKFQIKILGYPAMRTLDNFDPKYFFDLDLTMHSPYWIDYEESDVKQFIADFRRKFLTEPQEVSYAWMGYDIAYYFLSGLAIHGKEFLVHPEIHNPDLLHTRFDFRRKTTRDGFENISLFKIRFTKDYEVILLQ